MVLQAGLTKIKRRIEATWRLYFVRAESINTEGRGKGEGGGALGSSGLAVPPFEETGEGGMSKGVDRKELQPWFGRNGKNTKRTDFI